MLQRAGSFKVLFDEELKHGYTFDITLEELRSLTGDQIALKFFKEIRKAGVAIEVKLFIEELEE